jgi:Cytochrome C oxidase, cbb3-type, subunit III
MRSRVRRDTNIVAIVALGLGLSLLGGVGSASARTAKQDYDQNCASCHGPKGKGNGTAPAVMPLTPMPDITQLAKENGGTFPFDTVVDVIDGRKAIPSHSRIEMSFWGVTMQTPGAEFTPQSDAAVKKRIEALARYIETLQEK